MALIFPSNPTLNQVFSTGSLSWTWNGKSWNNGTSILVTSNLVSSSVQFTNGNTNAFDTTSNITVGQITASFAKISGSIFGTASFAILAQTSSYVENAQTASYVVLAQTASYVLNAVSASYSLTASYVALAQTASYVENAQTASYVTLAQTASYVTLSQTASYISTASYALAALSASYAPNIYVLPSNVVSASAQLSNNGGVAFDTNTNITVGQITASFAKITNLTVEYVTSSVMVITGSNKFGDASNDKQEFTGSVSMSGSLSVVGNVTSNNVLSLASGTVALPSLILSTDTTSGMYRIGANNIGISISAAKVLDISSTGLSVTGALSASGGYNGSVGATTRNTVAATTISTTGTVTATADNIKAFVGTTGAGTGFAYGTYETNGGAQYGRVGIEGSVGGTLFTGTSAYDFVVGSISGNTWIGAGGTGIAKVSGTGVAVTGALSATGILSGPGFRASKTTATSGLVKIQDEGANVYNVIGSRNNADSAALPLNFQATNFAFNGAVDITGGLVVGVAGTGTGITIKEYSAGTQRNWGIRDDSGVDRLRFSRGASDAVFWDVLKVAASDQTGNQIWYTNGAERMQLSSSGLLVTGNISNTFTGNTRIGHTIQDTTTTSDSAFIQFLKSTGGVIGQVTRVGTTDAVVYNTSSDSRLKENFRDFTDSGRLIDSLKPRVFDWKNSDDNGKNVVGFIAQEINSADPIFAHIGAVSVGDEDPDTITKQWHRSDAALIPILVAELKALRQRVAALEAK